MQNVSGRITIKEVARQAGVSTQTVSRVINNRPDVAPETRRRVQEVIDRLGYQPSELARSLIQKRSKTLGLVIAGLKYSGPARTLNGITDQAEALGYALLLKELADFSTDEYQPSLNALLARQVDGILWAVPEIGANRAWLQPPSSGIPVPGLFITMAARPGLSIVSVDNFLGGRLATEHLLDRGYRRIGHIAGPLAWWEAQQRKAGWEAALRDAGLPANASQWVEGNWSSASGGQAVGRLWERYPQMQAVFVANDQMALGVLAHSHRHGQQIPGDLAVVGFDGIAESAYFWPPLTTIHQDLYQLGCTAVAQLVERIEAMQEGNPQPAPRSVLLSPELIVREST